MVIIISRRLLLQENVEFLYRHTATPFLYLIQKETEPEENNKQSGQEGAAGKLKTTAAAEIFNILINSLLITNLYYIIL